MLTQPDLIRSRNMAAVKSKDTKPEWLVRRMLHAAGYRYRLHVKGLPGRPDLVFPSRRKVIFVNGSPGKRAGSSATTAGPSDSQSWLPIYFGNGEPNLLNDATAE